MLARLCSKSFKLDFRSMWTKNFQKRQRNQRSNCQHLLDHRKSKGIAKIKSISAILTMLKPLAVWITTNCGKFFKGWKHLTTLPPSWEVCIQDKKPTVRTGHGANDWFKIRKEYVKAVYRHPSYLTYLQSTSCKMPGWMTHKLESKLPREISTTSDMQMTPL